MLAEPDKGERERKKEKKEEPKLSLKLRGLSYCTDTGRVTETQTVTAEAAARPKAVRNILINEAWTA